MNKLELAKIVHKCGKILQSTDIDMAGVLTIREIKYGGKVYTHIMHNGRVVELIENVGDK